MKNYCFSLRPVVTSSMLSFRDKLLSYYNILGRKKGLHTLSAESLPSSKRHKDSEEGFTLIELILVITLIALMMTVAAQRIDSVLIWKQRAAVRQFANVWQFLYGEALGKSQAYRLIIDFSGNSYAVRREIPLEEGQAKNVDYLAHWRSQSEKERKANEVFNKKLSIDQEFTEEDTRQSGSLEKLFYQDIYADPYVNVRLGLPLDFKHLGERQFLAADVSFADLLTAEGKQTEGVAFIRLSPRGGSSFAVVHLSVAGKFYYTVSINPLTGKMSLEDGYKEIEYKK